MQAHQTTRCHLAALIVSLRPLALFFITALSLTFISRLLLMLWQHERISGPDDVMHILFSGLRIDLSTLCYLSLPVILLAWLLPQPTVARAYTHRMVTAWLLLVLLIIGFMEAVTPGFIQEYDIRPNRLFVEYLLYPKEVGSMLWGGYKLELFSVIAVTLVLAWLLRQLFRNSQQKLFAPWYQYPLLGAILLLVCALGARGTLQHRPINPSYTAFSSDPLVNSLTLNSLYSLLYAVDQMADEEDAAEYYGQMPAAEIITEVRRQMLTTPLENFVSAGYPTWHHQAPSEHKLPRYRNLVIILQESLGAQFVGSLGGLELTPELDKLTEEGWLLERLYATGTRSVRGIEAVVTGFVPTPARSVVKLPGSQQDFFTLASLLETRGYDTSFIYGGEGHFDNMAGFFLANGFQRVIDQRQYTDPKFTGSWGVSDEDLFNRADQEFDTLSEQEKPFFSLVFTSSNHSPFEFPTDSFQPEEQPVNSRHNAIRYADHALGQFFREAKRSAYWQDTLFLVVADHDARVHGAELVPVKHYHIPGLLLGKDMPARRDPRIFSQIDLPPSLLSLLDITAPHPMTGVDITRVPENYRGRAIMQYDRNQAYMSGNEVVILQPHQLPRQFLYHPATGELSPTELNQSLARTALAHALWGSLAYRQNFYRARLPISELAGKD